MEDHRVADTFTQGVAASLYVLGVHQVHFERTPYGGLELMWAFQGDWGAWVPHRPIVFRVS